MRSCDVQCSVEEGHVRSCDIDGYNDQKQRWCQLTNVCSHEVIGVAYSMMSW